MSTLGLMNDLVGSTALPGRVPDEMGNMPRRNKIADRGRLEPLLIYVPWSKRLAHGRQESHPFPPVDPIEQNPTTLTAELTLASKPCGLFVWWRHGSERGVVNVRPNADQAGIRTTVGLFFYSIVNLLPSFC
jgi:hypothetical protein